MATFALDDLIICLTFFITYTKPAISNSIGQEFHSARVKSLKRKKTGCIKEADGQCLSRKASLVFVWKITTLKPNFFNAFKSIHRTFPGLWYTRVDGWLKMSWILMKKASFRGVRELSFVFEVYALYYSPLIGVWQSKDILSAWRGTISCT